MHLHPSTSHSLWRPVQTGVSWLSGSHRTGGHVRLRSSSARLLTLRVLCPLVRTLSSLRMVDSDRRVLASRYRLAQPRSTVYIQYGIESYSSKAPRLTSLAYSFLLPPMSFSSNPIAGCIHGRCFSSTRRDSNGSGYSPKSTTLATVRQLGNPTACISSLWGLGPRTICSAWGWSSLWRSQISNSNCAPNFFYKATWSASTFFIVIRHDLFVYPSHNCVNHYK